MKNLERQIVEMLKIDARMSAVEIASGVESDEQKVKAVIRKLEETGAILGYTTLVNEDVMTDSTLIQAFVELSIRPEKETGYDAIAKRIYKYPNVVGHFLLSGAYDFLVIVEGNSHKDIAAFVFDKLATLDNVKSTNTHFIFKKYKDLGIIMERGEKQNRMAVVA